MLPQVELGPLPVNTFDAARLLSVVVAGLVFLRLWKEEDELGQRMGTALLVFAAAVAVGAAGSSVWDFLRQLPIQDPFVALRIDQGSKWIFAGMLCALAGGAVVLRLEGEAVLRGLDALAVAVLVGHVVHRIGCFLAGDGCYGHVTDLPWAVAFPEGSVPVDVPVHPTMLYEAGLLAAGYVLLRKLPRGQGGTRLAQTILLMSGVCFITQFYMITPSIAFGLTEAQLTALVLGLLATFYLARSFGYQAYGKAISRPRVTVPANQLLNRG